MNAMTIREGTQADLPVLAMLYASSGVDPAALDDRERMAVAWARLRREAPNAKVLIAEEGDRAVGTLTLYLVPTLGHAGTPAALVESVAVDPKAQGRGIGRALMDEAMARARAAGCYKLALSSNDKRSGAHAFYEQLGYERHGVSFVVHLQDTAA